MSTPEQAESPQDGAAQDQQSASGGWLGLGLRVLDAGYALLVVAHLSTIVEAAQDRAQFEAVFGADGALLRASAAVLACWLALRWVVGLVAFADRNARVLATSTLLLWSLHAAGIGMGKPAFSPIEYDAWCAAMSATWFAIPWRAMACLLALVLTAIEVKQSLSRRAGAFIPTGRLGTTAARYRVGVAWLAAIAIGVLGAKGVFALATGSGAIF